MPADLILVEDIRPPRADAVRNRELLLEVAERLFAERGVEAVPMSAIAQEAGVGKGTLYRHFPDKLQLCHALLDHQQRELQERTLEHLRTERNPQANLRWFVSELVGFVLRNENLFAGVPISGGLLMEHPAHLWWRQTIRGLLAQSAGARLDADYAADVLYAMLDAGTLRFQQRHGYSRERILDGLNDLIDRFLAQA